MAPIPSKHQPRSGAVPHSARTASVLLLAEAAARGRASIAGAERECPALGLPRPFGEYSPKKRDRWFSWFPYKRLPIPWISWDHIKRDGNWTGFDEEALEIVHEHDYKLCGICGLALGAYKVFGRYPGPGNTTGPGMHAACALLSYHYCPHLLAQTADEAFEIAHTEGHGLSFDDVGGGRAGRLDAISDIPTVGAVAVTIAELRALAQMEHTSSLSSASAGDATDRPAAARVCPVTVRS